MIGHALDLIVKELNAYFVQLGERDDLVVLERLVNDKGESVAGNGKVCCSLVNMEEERIGKQQTSNGDANVYGVRKNPDIRVNLYLLFAVNTAPEGYLNGLHLLSHVVTFFQGKTIFTPQNSPAMNAGLQQLSVELFPLTIENQNHLWAGLGAKYLPSALYKLRLVALRDERQLSLEPLISTLNIQQGGHP